LFVAYNVFIGFDISLKIYSRNIRSIDTFEEENDLNAVEATARISGRM